MWNPKPGEVYAAYQWWDTFESWSDHFSVWKDILKADHRFWLFRDTSRRKDIRRAHFEFEDERQFPFWLARMRVEITSHLKERPELEEQVRQAVTVSFDVAQKRQVLMLAAAEWYRCDALPCTAGIEVPPYPGGSYEVELSVANSDVAEALASLRGDPASGGDWLLIRVYLHIMKLREVR